MGHWTYSEVRPDSDLDQGDILSCTESLHAILETVHPHFCADKYLGFIVTTQSCDLVKRPKPKARYLSIAVIRSLRDVFPRLLEHVSKPLVPGVFQNSSRFEASQFLSRVFNQNEHAHGLFYLHPDADVGLGEPSVAFLRVTVALRADHYDALVSARRGALTPEFRSKLGWLLGNLYARPATMDWGDTSGGKEQLDTLIKTVLENKIPGRGPVWVDDVLVTAAKEARFDFGSVGHDLIATELEKFRPRPSLERVVDAVLAEAAKIYSSKDSSEDDSKKLHKLRNRLLNNGTIKKLIRSI